MTRLRRLVIIGTFALQTLALAWLVWTFRTDLHQKLAARFSCRYLFLGDSITAQAGIWGARLHKWWPDDQNYGRSGADLFQIDLIAQEVIPVRRPPIVIVMGGTNDTARHDLPEMIRDYDHLLATLRASESVQHVVVVSTLPDVQGRFTEKIEGLNQHLVTTCQSAPGLTFLDLRPSLCSNGKLRPEFSRDGVHLNARGYEAWANALRPVLKAVGNPDQR